MKHFLFAALVICSWACNKAWHGEVGDVDYIMVNADSTQIVSTEAKLDFLEKYRSIMQDSMGSVIGHITCPMKKDRPESTLGNFVSDHLLDYFNRKGPVKIDFATTNLGGLRVPVLDTGDLSLGDVFELMPFDNTAVIATVTSDQLKKLFVKIINEGGWPISRSLELIAYDSLQYSALVNGKPLQDNKKYRVLINNYIANGGDNCQFMKEWQKIDSGVLLRDALIEQIQFVNSQGRRLCPTLDGRLVIFSP